MRDGDIEEVTERSETITAFRDRPEAESLLIYRCASRLNEAAVVRMPSAYGVPAKPNSLANLLESKRYGPSLWYSISEDSATSGSNDPPRSAVPTPAQHSDL